MRAADLAPTIAAAPAPAAQATAASPPIDADHAAKMASGLALFKEHVRPVLLAKCFKCHGGESVESSLDINDRAGLLKGGDNGAAVVVNSAQESLLYKLVAHSQKPHMPFEADQLSAEAIDQIGRWIDQGAPYDRPLKDADVAGSQWYEKTVPINARKFWSFQPLASAAPPVVKNTGWRQSPIDDFVLAKMEAAGVAPNPPASKRQLIRRVYFDLIGLPSTPEEIDAFEKDSSPDAYEKVVDRLLASQHFGERWARRWLDLARFAESHGFEHDSDRPTAYPYRDFVIRAFNDDLPYDTFIKWQLAGDEYEPENALANAATGFLAAGVHSTQITKNEAEKHRYDEMDDMVATMGASMLGLTIGCARCHDHKYDPIPQRDYYRLLSNFTTTVRSETDLPLDSEGYRKAKQEFDKQHEPLVAALKKYETDELPAKLAGWEKSRPAKAEKIEPWVVLQPTSLITAGGATFTKLDDGSYLATGANAKFDTYTFTAETSLAGITSLRIEPLADASMPHGGPGRAANGNFDLTDLRATVLSKHAKPGEAPIAIRLRNPRATFEQPGLPIKATIDGDAHSGWAVDPQFGKDHAAVYELDPPLTPDGPATLTVVMQFNGNDHHNFGRLRISVSTAAPPVELQTAALPAPVVEALLIPADKRTAAQQANLFTWYRARDADWRNLNAAVESHSKQAPKPAVQKTLIASEGLAPIRLHTQGDDYFKETYFLRRGDVNQKAAAAPPGVLQVLDTAPDREKHWQSAPPPGWRTSYRRRALAEWMTDHQYGAGNLLARVAVNRLWQFHFGRGIVATPSDFGARGEPPTHPQLLDYLAGQLIGSGWRLKSIHKMIAMSAAYKQSAEPNGASAKLDPENHLLWRHGTLRLEAEAIRDSLLVVSGSLDSTIYGPGTLDAASRRRSIYFTVKRSALIPMLTVFDAPDALGSMGVRPTTTVAPQALYLMNNPQVRQYARSFASRIAPKPETTLEDAVSAGYLIALGRAPTADEAADSLAFLNQQIGSHQRAGKRDSRLLGLADFCQTLMCLNEFVYVE